MRVQWDQRCVGVHVTNIHTHSHSLTSELTKPLHPWHKPSSLSSVISSSTVLVKHNEQLRVKHYLQTKAHPYPGASLQILFSHAQNCHIYTTCLAQIIFYTTYHLQPGHNYKTAHENSLNYVIIR